MDGFPRPKSKLWKGQLVSETRFYVNSWLKSELPKISGTVLNVGAGGSTLPKELLDFTRVSKYTTFDQKLYGDSRNPVDVYGDVHNMPNDWTGTWDNILCIEVFECLKNPFVAIEELHRILKPGGSAFITAPFAYTWFGYGSTPESLKKKSPVKDYWRISEDGWKLLTQNFSYADIKGFGGEVNSRFVYCIKATK